MHTSYKHLRPYVDTACATHSTPIPWRRAVRWAGVIKTWLERSRQRRALAELDDRMLCDIGVTRSQAREASKPFWSTGRGNAPQC